jgi:multidrug resistance efflux pump
MNRRKWILVISLVFVLLTGGVGYLYYAKVYSHQAKITATGTIEVTTADITPKVGGI